MRVKRSARACRIALCAVIALAAKPVQADDPCAGFSWNVSRELALFAGKATELAAGADSAAAAALTIGHLYRLRLRPTADVTFVAAPGKRNAVARGYAGLAAVDIRVPGTYRIAVDGPFWIDVVADGGLIPSTGHQGAAGCSGPHKIVEFDFSVARRLLLQFSGADTDSMRVTVTQAAR